MAKQNPKRPRPSISDRLPPDIEQDIVARLDPSIFDRLPRDVEGYILARLPVRSLLVCQFVSKRWKSIIWSPSFMKIHGRVFPDSCKGTFFMCEIDSKEANKSTKFCLAKYDDDLEHKQDIKVGTVYKRCFMGARPYCSCNGIVLLVRTTGPGKCTYILLNPVTGMYKEIICAYEVGPHNQSVYGLSFDRERDDFKIVTIFGDKYFTYSCKSDTWSPMKEFIYDQVDHFFGISMNGKFYMVFGRKEQHEWYILHFNNRDGTFVMLPKLQGMNVDGIFMSESLDGHLCVGGIAFSEIDFENLTEGFFRRRGFQFMKLEGESWIESTGTRDAGLKRFHGFIPHEFQYTCENGLIIRYSIKHPENFWFPFQRIYDIFEPDGWEYASFLSCAETLFFPCGIQGNVEKALWKGDCDLLDEDEQKNEGDGDSEDEGIEDHIGDLDWGSDDEDSEENDEDDREGDDEDDNENDSEDDWGSDDD